MKTGLILEGGAMRGMYTAGVLDTFLKHNIEVDSIVGASAGALFGVNYLSKQSGRVIRYNKKYNRDKNYMGLKPLIKEGNIISTKYAYNIVPHKLDIFDDETYKKSPITYYAVVTNIEDGKGEYIQIKSVFEQMDVLRASGSMPFVSKPVEIDGKLYLDGGIVDSIPYKWLMEKGVDKLIVILTRDINYRKKPMCKPLTKLFYKKYPALRERLNLRHQVYNDSVKDLRNLEKQGKVFIFRPSTPIEIGRTEKNPQKLQEVYDLGIRDCEQSLSNLLKYLNKT